MTRRRVLVLLACGLASECGGAERTSTVFQVDTLDSGVIRVTNDGTGAWTEQSRWTLEQDLRLGTVDGEGPELFSQIGWIDEDERGRIYILDSQAQDIRVFEPDGGYSHTIGGRGEGPGELMFAAGMNWAPNGDIWVWGLRRYTVFTPSGDFVDSWNRIPTGVIYPWNGGFLSNGDYIDWGLDRQRGPNPNETTGLTTFYPIRFTPPAQYDTLPPLQFQAWMRGPGQMARGMNKSLMVAQAAAGHTWFAHSDEYALYKRSMEGDTLLISTLPAQARPVTDAEIDSIIRLYVEQGIPQRPEPDEFVRERRLVTRLVTDDRGHVYVFPEDENVVGGSVIDVFRDDGVYLGRMGLDEIVVTRGLAPLITGEHVYGMVSDELGVPFVVRWRIVRPDRRSDVP